MTRRNVDCIRLNPGKCQEDCCEHGNKPSGSTNIMEFLDHLYDPQLLKAKCSLSCLIVSFVTYNLRIHYYYIKSDYHFRSAGMFKIRSATKSRKRDKNLGEQRMSERQHKERG
jgi:hypothetical protein